MKSIFVPLFLFFALYISQAQELNTTMYIGTKTSLKEGILSKTTQKDSVFLFSDNNGRSSATSGYEYYSNGSNGVNIPFSSINYENSIYSTGTSSASNSPKGDFTTVKVDEEGTVIWEAREEAIEYSVEYGTVISVDDLGNPIVGGVHWNGNNMDIKIIKYDALDGHTLWSEIFNGSGDGIDTPTAMSIDSAQNIIVTGVSYTGQGVSFVTLKYDANGNLLWSVTDTEHIPNTWNEPLSVTIDSNNNSIVSGFGYDENLIQGYYTISYNEFGEENWRSLYVYNDQGNDTFSIARNNTTDTNGNTYVTGTFNTLNNIIGTIKYDENGTIVWTETYNHPNDYTDGYDIRMNTGGALIVSGRHFGDFQEDGITVISYNVNGTFNWEYNSNTIVDPRKVFVESLPNDEIGITSFGLDPITFDQRIEIHKIADSGTLIEEVNYTIPYSPFGGINQLINCNIFEDTAYWVSWSFYSNDGDVFEFTKMPLDANEPDWSEKFVSTSTSMQMLSSIIDNNNNIYVAGRYGTIINNEYFENFEVVKYNPTGQVEWQQTFNQSNGNAAVGMMIGVDNSQNLMVYLIPDGFQNDPIRLKKYDPQGNLLWEIEKELFFPNIYTMFFDAEDNVILAGNSFVDPADDHGMFTVSKFSSEGEESWTTFHESLNLDDNIYDLKSGGIDANGDIIVTGHLGIGDFFNLDINAVVLKFSEEGTFQWLSPIEIPDVNTSGVEVLLDASGSIYIAGYSQNESYFREAFLSKLNTEGVDQWLSVYNETDRSVSPYNIELLSTGHIVMSNYSLSTDGSNRIALVNIDATGDQMWAVNSDSNHFYRDMYVDDANNTYVLNQVYSTTYPERNFYSAGPFTVASLLVVDEQGNTEEEFFIGPELSTYNPVSLSAHNDGRLLMGGNIAHELNVFEGLYFFETQHIVLDVNDYDFPPQTNNWLGQNYPNPVDKATSIPFFLEDNSDVTFKVFDDQGRKIISMDLRYPAGNSILNLNLSSLQTGLYFYSMQTNTFKATKKMIIK